MVRLCQNRWVATICCTASGRIHAGLWRHVMHSASKTAHCHDCTSRLASFRSGPFGRRSELFRGLDFLRGLNPPVLPDVSQKDWAGADCPHPCVAPPFFVAASSSRFYSGARGVAGGRHARWLFCSLSLRKREYMAALGPRWLAKPVVCVASDPHRVSFRFVCVCVCVSDGQVILASVARVGLENMIPRAKQR